MTFFYPVAESAPTLAERVNGAVGLSGGVVYLMSDPLAPDIGTGPTLSLVGGATTGNPLDRNATVIQDPTLVGTLAMAGITNSADASSNTDLAVDAGGWVEYLCFRTGTVQAATLASHFEPGGGPNLGHGIKLNADGEAAAAIEVASNPRIFLAQSQVLSDGEYHWIGVLGNRDTGFVYLADSMTSIAAILSGRAVLPAGTLATTTGVFSIGQGEGATVADLEVLFYGLWRDDGSTAGQLAKWTERDIWQGIQNLAVLTTAVDGLELVTA